MNALEIASKFQIRRLSKDEVVSSFDCGDDDLNDFILNESQRYRKAKLAVSYVIEDKESFKVVGFSASPMIEFPFLISRVKLNSINLGKHVLLTRKE